MARQWTAQCPKQAFAPIGSFGMWAHLESRLGERVGCTALSKVQARTGAHTQRPSLNADTFNSWNQAARCRFAGALVWRWKGPSIKMLAALFDFECATHLIQEVKCLLRGTLLGKGGQAVKIGCCFLGFARGREDGALVVAENAQPGRQVRCVIPTRLGADLEIGAEKAAGYLGDQFFRTIALIAEPS